MRTKAQKREAPTTSTGGLQTGTANASPFALRFYHTTPCVGVNSAVARNEVTL